jgi:hypothetical protein
MIYDIFDSGQGIFKLSPRLCAKKEAERLKLANLLELIGHMVNDSAVRLYQGQCPAGKHRQMELLSDELYFRLAYSVGEIKARTLSGKLKQGYRPDQLQSELDQGESTHHYLTLLEDAADFFLAASDHLRKA